MVADIPGLALEFSTGQADAELFRKTGQALSAAMLEDGLEPDALVVDTRSAGSAVVDAASVLATKARRVSKSSSVKEIYIPLFAKSK